MPSAEKYFPPGTTERRDLDTSASAERRERIKLYNLAVKYHEGDHDQQLELKEGEPDDNVVINLVKQTIERQSAFLFPNMPKFELDPTEIEETEEERWIRQGFESNKGLALLHSIAESGALSGHNYVRIKPPSSSSIHRFPKIIHLDPRHMTSFWRAGELDEIIFHEMRWESAPHKIHLIDFINNGDSWDIKEYVSENSGTRFVPVEREVLWNHPYGPIIHWQHLPNPHEFYGRADFTNADKKLQDKVNLIYSEIARINRYHASPRMIAIGVAADDIQETAIDQMWAIEDSDVDIKTLEMMSELRAAMELGSNLRDTYLNDKRVVVLEDNVKDFQRVTNTGVRMVFLDMLAKLRVLDSLYMPALQEIAFMLTLLSTRFDSPVIPEIQRSDPLPTDMKELVDVYAIERSMGSVSLQTVSTKLGHNWDEEHKHMQEEANDPVLQAFIGGADLSPNTSVPSE